MQNGLRPKQVDMEPFQCTCTNKTTLHHMLKITYLREVSILAVCSCHAVQPGPPELWCAGVWSGETVLKVEQHFWVFFVLTHLSSGHQNRTNSHRQTLHFRWKRGGLGRHLDNMISNVNKYLLREAKTLCNAFWHTYYCRWYSCSSKSHSSVLFLNSWSMQNFLTPCLAAFSTSHKNDLHVQLWRVYHIILND